MAKPSKGCWVRNRADSSRQAGTRPPWTMAKSAWAGFVRAASERSAQRCVRSIAARTSPAAEVEGRQTSSAIMTSEPMAVWTSMDRSGERRWNRWST